MAGIVDVTHLLDKEEGSAFDSADLLFGNFGDGQAFFYDQARVRDMEKMFETYGKSRTLEAALSLPIRGARFHISPERSSAKVHEFVESVLLAAGANGGMSTSMNMLIAQMTQAFVYKKAYFEKVWTAREGRVVYDKLAWRPPATCQIVRDEKNGAFQGFSQMPIRLKDTDPITIKPDRAFVYIHGTHRNPMEGTSDLDVTYWCYQTAQKIRFLWYSFLEGQALPKTIIKGKDKLAVQKAVKQLIALRSGGIAGIEETSPLEISPHESSGKGADQFLAALKWLESEASNSVLAGFTDLGSTAAGGTGSFALSKDQTDFFLMSEEGKASEMADAINQYIIPDLVAWNFGPKEPIPLFEFGPIAEDDAASAISLLQATAVTQSPVLPREFYDELIERVASFLGLNTQTVREGLDKARAEAEAKAAAISNNPEAVPVAGMAGAVNAAATAIATRRISGGPSDGSTDNPFPAAV